MLRMLTDAGSVGIGEDMRAVMQDDLADACPRIARQARVAPMHACGRADLVADVKARARIDVA